MPTQPPVQSSHYNVTSGAIIARIEKDAGVRNLADILANRISPADLQSLLLMVYRLRAKKRAARMLLHDYVSNRFARPSSTSPQRLLEWDRIAFSRLPRVFKPIELSPVCPLGTVSVLTGLSQDWTLSTIRNTEVVSDSTNVLALECAARRREQIARNGSEASVHLAASHRLVRGQGFGTGPGVRQHFRAFTLCSGGRDSGNLRFQTNAMVLHIRFFLAALREYLGPRTTLRVAVSDFGSSSIRPRVQKDVIEKLRAVSRKTKIEIDQDRKQARGYYDELCFKIFAASPKDREYEVVDGGDVDWTQKLLNNKKERLFISGCGGERLCELFDFHNAKRAELKISGG